MKYRPEIDGLRAVAALSVVIFHLNKTVFPGGYLGVDVFFVISGFLISSIISKQIAAGTWSFQNFYVKRLKRLAPAMIFVCLATLFAAFFIVGPKHLVEIGRSGMYWCFMCPTSTFGCRADISIRVPL